MVQDDHDNNDNNIKSINATVHINYTGKYYQLENISVASKPFQKPHPPIFIGTWGSSEASLTRAAKYGDGWMASAYNITPDKFREKWNMLLSYRKRRREKTKEVQLGLVTLMSIIGNVPTESLDLAEIESPSPGKAVEKVVVIVCPYCESKFENKSDLSKHIDRIHVEY